MSLIIDAEFPAGLTIEGAIRSALTFAEKNGCLVRAKLNDETIVFCNAIAFGETIEERVAYYANEYRRNKKAKEAEGKA